MQVENNSQETVEALRLKVEELASAVATGFANLTDVYRQKVLDQQSLVDAANGVGA